MPYGLTNAPAVFQSMVNEIFRDLLNQCVIAYIDDILIYSSTREDHMHHVQTVLTCLMSLGYVLSPGMVEMDQSNVQAVTDWPFLGFATFYHLSLKGTLTAAETNYDVGNRELLSIKAALEEWRHWLEGTQHPFSVLTDHRNLEYLWGAKCHNPRQTRWALFFTRFNFTVTYCPGTKNSKADALSCLMESKSSPTLPDPILPSSLILAPIQWNLVKEIQRTHAKEAPPAACPPSKLYVPALLRLRVLQWVHDSPSNSHPGIQCTAQLTQRPFWWPSLSRDTADFVKACMVCTQSRTSHQLPEGLLEPLPIPQCPWSHIAVDFLTNLPDSRGFTNVLVIVDRFSKAWETALDRSQQVFRNYGLRPSSRPKSGGHSVASWGLPFPPTYQISTTFHAALLKPAHEPQSDHPAHTEPPPLLDNDGAPAYMVHALLNSCRLRNRLQYLVDWESYGPEERSWVNAMDILDPSLTEEFHRARLDRALLHPLAICSAQGNLTGILINHNAQAAEESRHGMLINLFETEVNFAKYFITVPFYTLL
ncbi:hypothetical protein QTP70_008464 [Hemibagrus guttatus]|uniref:Gypsy retrotransposon integrase-like protein 1 n=1 Tax=Hemibagrus guttatus TaxID=175788 RepID=A0AAE0ULF8_9TELE|nr:hypothetical protein QTP70_008464 [Hemibagrus guttatus]